MNRRRLLIGLLGLVVLIACSQGWRRWQLAHPDRSHTMTALTQDMRTYCVGRLLIDLPQHTTSKSRSSGARIGDLNLSVTTGVSREQFDQMVEKRWLEVQGLKGRGVRYLSIPAEHFEPIPGSAIFAYGFRKADGPDVNGVWGSNIFHDAEGYFWEHGTLFEIKQNLNGKDEIAKLLPRLRARALDEIPSQPGLCLNGAFISGFYDMQERENLLWAFKLPRNMGLVVKHNRVGRPQPSLLERNSEAEQEMAAFIARVLSQPGVEAGREVYRAAARSVQGLDGEEYSMGGAEKKSANSFTTNIAAEWEFPGQGLPIAVPNISLSLGSTYRTSQRPASLGAFPNHEDAPNGPTEAEFFEVWDAVINSVRIRPHALTPPPK